MMTTYTFIEDFAKGNYVLREDEEEREMSIVQHIKRINPKLQNDLSVPKLIYKNVGRANSLI